VANTLLQEEKPHQDEEHQYVANIETDTDLQAPALPPQLNHRTSKSRRLNPIITEH